MKSFDIEACRQTLQRRQRTRRAESRSLWEQAHADTQLLIEHIVKTYQPTRIIQWGSILDPDRFSHRSDIDIAVEGSFSPATWFQLLGDAMRMTRFSVDIVDLGHVESEFADIIRMKGRIVYERDARSD
jgi:predicted nucleotidyltransferase